MANRQVSISDVVPKFCRIGRQEVEGKVLRLESVFWAGEILRESSQTSKPPEIHGLTSAAAIWVAAALGIAAGCGLWQLGLMGTILTVIILHIFKRLEKFY